MESNGSTSMASICGGCLVLWTQASLSSPQWLVSCRFGNSAFEGGGFEACCPTIILGAEDHYDMDFKIAGTREGATDSSWT